MKYFGSKFKPEILGSQATKNWFCDCVCILDHVADVKHTHLTALFAGLPGWAGTRKLKPMWILLKQETVSGSGISWAVCKSTRCSRQITTPAPHHSVFSGRMLFPPPRSWCYCVCVCGWVFRDLLEEVVPLMKEAIDRKAENPRRKKRRDVLRLSLLRVLLYMANNGIFTRWLVTRPY